MCAEDLYRDMLKYRTGSDEQGNSQFSVPLESDEDGLLGRECPSESCTPRYFKVHVAEDDEDDSISYETITCPYCGTRESFQEFHTQAQIDWVSATSVFLGEGGARGSARMHRNRERPLGR